MCLAIAVVDRICIGASESGTGHCTISVVDTLVFGVCFDGTSVSGVPVVI